VQQRLNLFHNFLSFSLDTENALHLGCSTVQLYWASGGSWPIIVLWSVASEWRERLRTSAVTRFLIHKQRRQYRARLSSISKKVPRAISISIGKRFRVTFDVIPYFLCSLGYSAIYNTARAYSSLTKLVNNRKKTIQGLQSVPCVNIVFLDNFSDR